MLIQVKTLPHADIIPENEQGDYRLADFYQFTLRLDGRLYLFTINQGFIYDGASVPRWARWLIERDGVHREAALIHDWLYECEGTAYLDEEMFHYTRKDADQIFRECLKFKSLASWKVFLMYNAVRIGGRFVW